MSGIGINVGANVNAARQGLADIIRQLRELRNAAGQANGASVDIPVEAPRELKDLQEHLRRAHGAAQDFSSIDFSRATDRNSRALGQMQRNLKQYTQHLNDAEKARFNAEMRRARDPLAMDMRRVFTNDNPEHVRQRTQGYYNAVLNGTGRQGPTLRPHGTDGADWRSRSNVDNHLTGWRQASGQVAGRLGDGLSGGLSGAGRRARGAGMRAFGALAGIAGIAGSGALVTQGFQGAHAENAIADEMFRKLHDTGQAFGDLKHDIIETGRAFGLTGEEALGAAKVFAATSLERDRQDIVDSSELSNAMARAHGVDPNQMAMLSGSLQQFGIGGQNKAEKREFAAMIGAVISEGGLSGAPTRVLEDLMAFTQARVSATGSAPVDQIDEFLRLRLATYQDPALRGNAGMAMMSKLDQMVAQPGGGLAGDMFAAGAYARQGVTDRYDMSFMQSMGATASLQTVGGPDMSNLAAFMEEFDAVYGSLSKNVQYAAMANLSPMSAAESKKFLDVYQNQELDANQLDDIIQQYAGSDIGYGALTDIIKASGAEDDELKGMMARLSEDGKNLDDAQRASLLGPAIEGLNHEALFDRYSAMRMQEGADGSAEDTIFTEVRDELANLHHTIVKEVGDPIVNNISTVTGLLSDTITVTADGFKAVVSAVSDVGDSLDTLVGVTKKSLGLDDAPITDKEKTVLEAMLPPLPQAKDGDWWASVRQSVEKATGKEAAPAPPAAKPISGTTDNHWFDGLKSALFDGEADGVPAPAKAAESPVLDSIEYSVSDEPESEETLRARAEQKRRSEALRAKIAARLQPIAPVTPNAPMMSKASETPAAIAPPVAAEPVLDSIEYSVSDEPESEETLRARAEQKRRSEALRAKILMPQSAAPPEETADRGDSLSATPPKKPTPTPDVSAGLAARQAVLDRVAKLPPTREWIAKPSHRAPTLDANPPPDGGKPYNAQQDADEARDRRDEYRAKVALGEITPAYFDHAGIEEDPKETVANWRERVASLSRSEAPETAAPLFTPRDNSALFDVSEDRDAPTPPVTASDYPPSALPIMPPGITPRDNSALFAAPGAHDAEHISAPPSESPAFAPRDNSALFDLSDDAPPEPRENATEKPQPAPPSRPMTPGITRRDNSALFGFDAPQTAAPAYTPRDNSALFSPEATPDNAPQAEPRVIDKPAAFRPMPPGITRRDNSALFAPPDDTETQAQKAAQLVVNAAAQQQAERTPEQEREAKLRWAQQRLERERARKASPKKQKAWQSFMGGLDEDAREKLLREQDQERARAEQYIKQYGSEDRAASYVPNIDQHMQALSHNQQRGALGEFTLTVDQRVNGMASGQQRHTLKPTSGEYLSKVSGASTLELAGAA